MRAEITPGQASDYIDYDLVMADHLPKPAVLVADRGYASDKIREDVESRNAAPLRRESSPLDWFWPTVLRRGSFWTGAA